MGQEENGVSRGQGKRMKGQGRTTQGKNGAIEDGVIGGRCKKWTSKGKMGQNINGKMGGRGKKRTG